MTDQICAKVVPFKPETEYYFQEGCHIIEMLNSNDDPTLSIARARVVAGVTTKLHALKNTTERYLIQQGCGEVFVKNCAGQHTRQTVGVGDIVIIPADSAQQITNKGDEDLVFLAICTPRFDVNCYAEVDLSDSIQHSQTSYCAPDNKNKG